MRGSNSNNTARLLASFRLLVSYYFFQMVKRYLPRGGPAVAMGVTMFAATSAVVYSHVSQTEERKVMRAGVERDKHRLRQKRLEKQRLKEEQENEFDGGKN